MRVKVKWAVREPPKGAEPPQMPVIWRMTGEKMWGSHSRHRSRQNSIKIRYKNRLILSLIRVYFYGGEALSKDKVLLLHQLLTQETGGSAGVRDYNLLDSALKGAFATFDGRDLYPTKQEKVARTWFSLISDHAFMDGNKRIGMHVMITFLEMNGIPLCAYNNEAARTGLALAGGGMIYGDPLKWIYDHETYGRRPPG